MYRVLRKCNGIVIVQIEGENTSFDFALLRSTY
jgi:hypothetical protein